MRRKSRGNENDLFDAWRAIVHLLIVGFGSSGQAHVRWLLVDWQSGEPQQMADFFEEDEAEWGNPWHHLLAGSVAGTVEHCGMFPLDTIKTHAQAAGAHASMTDISRDIFRRHGFRGFFRGLPAMISGAAPAHAVFFGMYEFTKYNLGGNMVGHHPVEVALAGASATIAMDGILTPMDAVKQRMQLSSGKYSNVIDCLRKVRAREGLRSLYAGYGTTLVMNVPYHAFFFTSYETLKKLVDNRVEESVGVHLACGALAGVVAAGLTNPLDVAKTRLQTQHDTGKRYSGMVGALTTIAKEEGFGGLFRGLKPRILLHSASSAIVWATYEYMKRLLAGDDGSHPSNATPVHVHSV